MAEIKTQEREGLPKHLLIAFAIALGGYVLFFMLDHYLRTHKGPWEVTFTTNQNGTAQIIINQPYLRITNVHVVLLGEHPTNGTGIVLFEKPLTPIPFGRTKFEDLTYLPGSVTFDLFGQEVEILPRTLYLNKREYGWDTAAHELSPSEKLPPSPETGRRKRR
jgi:hypothetical protein